MIVDLIAFAIGVVAGAFSHKWLAAEVTKTTGVDPNAAAAAVKQAAKKV